MSNASFAGRLAGFNAPSASAQMRYQGQNRVVIRKYIASITAPAHARKRSKLVVRHAASSPNKANSVQQPVRIHRFALITVGHSTGDSSCAM